MRFPLKLFSLLFLALLLIPMAGCRKESSFTDYIPADAEIVGAVNIENILKNLGVEESDSDLTTASEKLLSNYAPLFLELRKACDLSYTVAFSYNSKNYAVTRVRDSAALRSGLRDNLSLTPENQNGFEVYSYDNGFITIAVRDGECWLLQNPLTVSDLTATMQAAEEQSIIEAHAFLAETLKKSDDLMNWALNGIPGFIDTIPDNGWATISAMTDDSSLSLVCASLDSVGAPVNYYGLMKVSPDILPYMPSSDYLRAIVAVGIDGAKINWEKNLGALVALGGLQARGLLDYLLPFLVQINGTVAFGAAVSEGTDISQAQPSEACMTAMIHMDPNGISKALKTMKNQLSWFGSKLQTLPDGSLVLDMGDFKAYAANIDGYLTVSTEPFVKSDALQSLSSNFAGECKGIFNVEIASLQAIDKGLPEWGVKLSGQFRDNTLRVTARLSGTDRPVLQSLLDL